MIWWWIVSQFRISGSIGEASDRNFYIIVRIKFQQKNLQLNSHYSRIRVKTELCRRSNEINNCNNNHWFSDMQGTENFNKLFCHWRFDFQVENVGCESSSSFISDSIILDVALRKMSKLYLSFALLIQSLIIRANISIKWNMSGIAMPATKSSDWLIRLWSWEETAILYQDHVLKSRLTGKRWWVVTFKIYILSTGEIFDLIKVEVTVYKGNIPIFQKKTDLCDPKSKKSETFRVGLAIFAIPLACSFNSSTFCYKGERLVTFTQSTLRLLNAFPLNGRSAVFKMIITHDTGKSCFETEMEIYKE